MKHLCCTIILFATLSWGCRTAHRDFSRLADFRVTVTKISDGDTFEGQTADRRTIRFRIYAIDAPERSRNQPYWEESAKHLAGLILGRQVGIRVHGYESGRSHSVSYNRIVAWAITPEGKDVSAEMLRAGLAWHWAPDTTRQYIRLETESRSARRGLWADTHSVDPAQWRSSASRPTPF